MERLRHWEILFRWGDGEWADAGDFFELGGLAYFFISFIDRGLFDVALGEGSLEREVGWVGHWDLWFFHDFEVIIVGGALVVVVIAEIEGSTLIIISYPISSTIVCIIGWILEGLAVDMDIMPDWHILIGCIMIGTVMGFKVDLIILWEVDFKLVGLIGLRCLTLVIATTSIVIVTVDIDICILWDVLFGKT